MTGASSMHGNTTSGVTSSQGLNGVKLESQYYCNSYTPPTPVDHGGLLPPSYSKLNFYYITSMTKNRTIPNSTDIGSGIYLIQSSLFFFFFLHKFVSLAIRVSFV